MRILLSWIGIADLDQKKDDKAASIATIACRFEQGFDQVVLLNSLKGERAEEAEPFRRWLEKRMPYLGKSREHSKVELLAQAKIASPVDYHSITEYCEQLLSEYRQPDNEICINLTSGTPAMAAVWTILGYGVEGTTLLQTTPNNEILTVSFPNDIEVTVHKYAKYTKDAVRSIVSDEAMEKAFSAITARSKLMQDVVNRAYRLGKSGLPALILGETGTGKELIAKAIHKSSLRKDETMQVANCGAFAKELVESTLFGHVKGAFTGAMTDKEGYFVAAHNSTLFLDEVGELPLDVQAKLLRVLNESEVTPVGSVEVKKVNVRIVAATHRNLMEMVAQGTFREDLYYRLAVGVIELPPLRKRKEDLAMLIDELLDASHQSAKKHPDFQDAKAKKLSPQAKQWLSRQDWPGNIRELKNTIDRAVLWCEGDTIEEEDIAKHVSRKDPIEPYQPVILSSIDSVDLNGLIADINDKYCRAALNACGGNKSRAATMLGLKSHQVLSKRLKSSQGE